MTSHRLPEYRASHRGDDISATSVAGTATSLFEEIARLAATICEVPIAAVTLPDPDSKLRRLELVSKKQMQI